MSRGRRYPDPPHPYRNVYARDRDRVIHSRAFRRLEAKTQVFTAHYSDHFRNRLTHTIEVAQIARTAARVLGLDEDLTEALALVHDIGHPPFGHAGEAELDRQMRRFGARFDHNLHALRIVERFENRYARFPGLNLTFEVREGIVKHSRDFSAGEIPELDEYLPGLRPPLEAQLIDRCDEIAYNTSDLDDGYVAGLIPIEEARQAVDKFRELDDIAEMKSFPPRQRSRTNVRNREGTGQLADFGSHGGNCGGGWRAGLPGVGRPVVREHPGRVACFSAETAAGTAQLKGLLRGDGCLRNRWPRGRARGTFRGRCWEACSRPC